MGEDGSPHAIRFQLIRKSVRGIPGLEVLLRKSSALARYPSA